DGGAAVISAFMQTTCNDCPSQGLWFAGAAGLEPILFNQTQAPGAPAGFQIQSLTGNGSSGAVVAVNSGGQVAASVPVYNRSSYSALYGWTHDTGVFPIAVPNSQLEVGDGLYKTVLSAGIPATDLQSSSNLGDNGILTFVCYFSDGTSGVF